MQQPLPILTVSRLTALLKETVEDNFVRVLVEGEISNFSRPSSGHFYFSLKDARSQVRGVMFRAQNRLLPFTPEDGMQVVCAGRVSLYEPRGELQLVVEGIEPKGLGSLQLAFEQLKARLTAEGLFDPARKRPLPSFPRCIGVVTSASGAVLHDILNVLRRRGAGVRVVLRPALVQGAAAAGDIVAAIDELNRQGEADVLIVGRGGGSLEDLWAFNEESVARAVAASRIPVIAAVGHETDVTITDFAADLRAPTPSAAAEMVAKSRLELEGHLDHLCLRLGAQMRARLALLRERVNGLERRLRSPRQQIRQWREHEQYLEKRLQRGLSQHLRRRHEQLAAAAARLDALSPLAVLARGYAIVLREKDGRAVRDAAQVAVGEAVRVRLGQGQLNARVTEVKE
ncbi:Exodeoxyribonuclease VII large subunit [Geoalkalibacter ferrihydriticus]|uniref:Exodeoxyribonuclease 7 large subunit n=2 Tax=Geoalkalibacter ferrihydriticus TaxID=392333 RepID=A0A0C2HHI7_9BACT|nr:exodeoxyribonuclease VII large subunit [Geoalkalibacter ferrihydriticus]KIH76456.1 exodeoxyribonuclease VII large subunit [Geoalkalibacter ferrihydriticus DSM 17813]SDL96030.1 Exodeoxyribonuclease VII large subunit [Geoalkalibacter ferrihydriticus]